MQIALIIMCVIIGHYIFAVELWCARYFALENMNQFEMEKLKRANMDICGKICTKKAPTDTKSISKCQGNLNFYIYTSSKHIKIPSKYDVNEKARSDVTLMT